MCGVGTGCKAQASTSSVSTSCCHLPLLGEGLITGGKLTQSREQRRRPKGLSFRASDRCHWRGNPSPPSSYTNRNAGFDLRGRRKERSGTFPRRGKEKRSEFLLTRRSRHLTYSLFTITYYLLFSSLPKYQPDQPSCLTKYPRLVSSTTRTISPFFSGST